MVKSSIGFVKDAVISMVINRPLLQSFASKCKGKTRPDGTYILFHGQQIYVVREWAVQLVSFDSCIIHWCS